MKWSTLKNVRRVRRVFHFRSCAFAQYSEALAHGGEATRLEHLAVQSKPLMQGRSEVVFFRTREATKVEARFTLHVCGIFVVVEPEVGVRDDSAFADCLLDERPLVRLRVLEWSNLKLTLARDSQGELWFR